MFQQNFHNYTNLLLLVNQLLLSSTEHLVCLVYDSDSAHIASAISQQQTNKSLIILNQISLEDSRIQIELNYKNSIIISIFSQPPIKVLQFIVEQYEKYLINVNAKHLYIINTRIYQFDEVRNVIRKIQLRHIQMVLLEISENDDIIAYSYLRPFSTKSFNDLQAFLITSIKNTTNVRELIFPNDVSNTTVAYFSLSYNPPYVYQVQDFRSDSKYVGGIEIRMMELLMDHWNWTVHFCKADKVTMKIIQCHHCEQTQRKIDHVFKTTLHRHHPIHYCHFYDYSVMYPDSLYSFTAAQAITWRTAIGLTSFAHERLVIIVPTEWELSSIVWRSIFRSPLFNVWIVQILLFSIIRKLLQELSINTNVRGFLDIFFHTFGLTFGVTSEDVSSYTSRPERILVVSFMISAFLSSILWSGTLFEQFTSGIRTSPTINSLSDLLAARERKSFLIPPAYGVQIGEFTQQFGQPSLALEFDIMFHIFSGNLSFYYMLPESRAIQLLSNAGNSGGKWNEACKLFHIVPDLYVCK